VRIVSLLPSATEIVADLNLAGQLVGRSHECNWPEQVKEISVVSSSVIDSGRLDAREIDEAVKGAVQSGGRLYAVDAALLGELQPDVILAQDLCRVCAVSGDDIKPVGVRVISLGPHTIAEIAASVRYLAAELGVPERGAEVADRMLARIGAVRARVAGLPRPRVFVAEWTDPPYACGHWIPEMVEAAGGQEVLGRPGQRSVQTTWEVVRAAAPDVVVVAPCGFDLHRSREEAAKISGPWRVAPVDADRYFVRPAPSIAEGVELLAGILHGW
jgi:iron complex transport system substrate-binding protein